MGGAHSNNSLKNSRVNPSDVKNSAIISGSKHGWIEVVKLLPWTLELILQMITIELSGVHP